MTVSRLPTPRSRTPLVVFVVLLLLATPAAADSAVEHTYFSFQSDADEPLAGGISAVLEPPEAFLGTVGNEAGLTVAIFDPALGPYAVTLRPPLGSTLKKGFYRNTEVEPTTDYAGLSVSSSMQCAGGFGWFEIREFTPHPGGDGYRLTVDFEFHCESAQPAFQGTVAYRSVVSSGPPGLGTMVVTLDALGMVDDPIISLFRNPVRGVPGDISPLRRKRASQSAEFSVLPGKYVAYGGDLSPDAGYFSQWFENAPSLRADLATPIVVRPGEQVEISIVLDTPRFDDVTGSVFAADIDWLQATGITRGCALARFCLDEPVSRAQMAAFLSRGLRLPSPVELFGFRDVEGSPFEQDIERLAGAGITRGCSPNAFCPDSPVTRGEMAAFLVRAMGYSGNKVIDFIDDDMSEFEKDIEQLAMAGVTVGCNPPANDRFCPDGPVTRAQMAAFLHRALGGGTIYPG